MSWGRIDDGYHRHAKVRRCSLAARGLWATAFSWTADMELDGFIPADMVPKLAEGEDCEPLIAELTRVASPYEHGLWEPCDGGYQMHDYLDINPSAKSLAKKRTKQAKASSTWRKKRDRSVIDDASITGRSPGSGRDGTGELSESSSSSGRGCRGKPWRVVPAGEALTEQRLRFGLLATLAPEDVRDEWAKFVDHEFQKPRIDVDRTWRNWIREAKKREEQGALRLVSRPRSRTEGNVAAAVEWLRSREERRG